MAIAFLSGHS